MTSAKLARGVATGGRRFWKPFSHAVGALWHQITGVFFAIFAVFFAQNAWRTHQSWREGAEQHHFWVYFLMTLLFCYFSISAFMRARGRAR